jgi:hypothetical protein
MTFKVCLLGKFSVKVDETPVTGLESLNVQELFRSGCKWVYGVGRFV